MNIGITNIAENVGMGFENIILLIIFSGLIIYAARDFKIMLLMGLALSSGIFMWFYQAGYNYVPPLVIMFLFIVFLSFSLYASSKTSGGTIT